MPPAKHSAHDFKQLMERWQAVTKRGRLAGVPLGDADGMPVWGLESKAAAAGAEGTYLSTGVHGDEAAGPWALLEWAESNVSRLQSESFLLVPCFNPVGFTLNTRADSDGLDMNRRFHLPKARHMAAWKRWLKARTLKLGVCLHEDYDALGCYVYELTDNVEVADRAMKQVEPLIPRDPRRMIEGMSAKRGVIQRERVPKGIKGPEALVLTKLGCEATLTFETPSELAIDLRIAAQKRFLEAVCRG